jgi:hypothetical protein
MGEQKAPAPINKEKILLVEGKDEEYLFIELLEDLHINDIQVIPIGGKDKFSDNIKN